MKSNIKKKVVIANLEPFEGMFEDLVNLLGSKLPEARSFEGCISVNACIDEKKKIIVLYEVWASEEMHKNYVVWRKKTGVHDLISSHLKTRSFSYYTYLV